jgi:hypothetical protein
MDAKAFVAGWKHEKTSYMQLIKHGDLQASQQVAALNLTSAQTEQLWGLLDTVLTDTMYTLLLGLDGAANIGGVQHTFRLLAECGKVVSTNGELEAEAFAQFHART